MAEPLICQHCRDASLKWQDPYKENLLTEGLLECRACGATYLGIPGYMRAMGIPERFICPPTRQSTDIGVIEEQVQMNDNDWETVAYLGPDRADGEIDISKGAKVRIRYYI